jgi:hypothetical protein
MSSLDLSFGLGAAESVDSIEIRWPNGRVQVLDNIASNQFHQITEPAE